MDPAQDLWDISIDLGGSKRFCTYWDWLVKVLEEGLSGDGLHAQLHLQNLVDCPVHGLNHMLN